YELAEAVEIPVREPLDGVAAMSLFTVAEGHTQLSPRYVAEHVDRMWPAHPGASNGADGFGCQLEDATLRIFHVELTEVVETDFGWRRLRERGHDPFVAEIAEHSVACAAPRYAAELLLDRLEPLARSGFSVEVDSRGVDGREPAHRA